MRERFIAAENDMLVCELSAPQGAGGNKGKELLPGNAYPWLIELLVTFPVTLKPLRAEDTSKT